MRRLTVNLVFDDLVMEHLSSFFRAEILRELNTAFLFETLHHWNSWPWRSEVNLNHVIWVFRTVRVILELIAAVDLKNHFRNHIFCEIHEVMVISIGIVKLTC